MGGHLRALFELGVVAVLYVAYDVTRSLGNATPSRAHHNAERVVRLERLTHLDPERRLNHALSQVPVLEVASSYYYASLHFIVTPAVLIWLFRNHREHYGRARTVICLATALALIGFWLYPVMPPRMMTGLGVSDTLANVHQWGWWSGRTSAPTGLGGLANQFAAMPSLHIIWALWSGLSIARFALHRWVRAAGVAYPVLTALVVIGTGNHYLSDVIAGAAVLGVTTAVLATGSRLHPTRRGENSAGDLPDPNSTIPALTDGLMAEATR